MTYAASDISSQLQSVDSIIDSILASQVIQTQSGRNERIRAGITAADIQHQDL